MTDLKADTTKAMLRAWKTSLRSSLKDITYNRIEEGFQDNPNNIPSATEAYYDPVEEVWIYPEAPNPVQPPDNLTVPLKALIRSSKKETFKDNDILATDLKVSLLVTEWLVGLSGKPSNSDTITYLGDTYRIIKWDVDSVDVFYNFYIRKGA